MQTCMMQRIGKSALCLLMAVCLLCSAFFNVRKAEAIAPAIPAAGAALAALAAELGISETALIAGIAVTGVAATGLVAYGNAGTDTTLPPAPGFKPWDDLTPQEKQDWVGQDGSALDYQKQTIAWWALQYGLLEQTPNGDLEPTPEPDPQNDPDGNSRWNKLRNALIVLSVGGASVPLGEVVNAIADGLSDGIKGLLFSDDSLGLQSVYQNDCTVDGIEVRFSIADINQSFTYRNETYTATPTNWTNYYVDSQSTTNQRMVMYIPKYASTYYDFNMSISSGMYRSSIEEACLSIYPLSMTVRANPSSISAWTPYWTAQRYPSYLNAIYGGSYVFPNGAVYTSGAFTNTTGVLMDVDYGQLSDTPEGLTTNILNNNTYNNFINNYSDPGVDGYQRAITVPSSYGTAGYQPSYSDFVVVNPDENVTPLPDDEQLPSPNPDNPDNPDTPTTEYEQDFGQKVGELLAQPFDQLFPFCLIGDLREFLEILEDAGFGSNDHNGMRALSDEPVNGIDVIRFDLTGFNLDGVDYFEIELTPIHDFAVGFRGIATSVFIIMLLIGTFRFFINRGGE